MLCQITDFTGLAMINFNCKQRENIYKYKESWMELENKSYKGLAPLNHNGSLRTYKITYNMKVLEKL
jgi:hypothetical protein